MNSESNLKLHFTYITIILSGVVIVLATFHWTKLGDFTTYLSNAATMTSLILAVVAIFYSMISNGEFSKGLGSLSKVSEDVSSAKAALNGIVQKSDALIEAGSDNTKNLAAISNEMKITIQEINQTLTDFHVQNSDIREKIGLIPPRLEALEARMFEAPSTQSNQKPFSESISVSARSASVGEVFLKGLSLVGLFGIFSAIISSRLKKPLNLDKLEQTIDLGQAAPYIHGLLVGSNCADVIDMEPQKKFREFRIVAVNKYFEDISEEKMLSMILQKAENLGGSSSKIEETKKIWQQRFEKFTKLIGEA